MPDYARGLYEQLISQGLAERLAELSQDLVVCSLVGKTVTKRATLADAVRLLWEHPQV